MDASKNTDHLSLAQEGLPLIRELLTPVRWIYWADYLACTLVGWLSFALVLDSSFSPLMRGFWFVVAGLSLYRSAIFIHEIVHIKKGAVPYLTTVWNLLTGIPLLIPSFFYEGVHLSHHRRNVYGTSQDGEYLPFVDKGRFFILLFFVSNLLFPLVLLFRHLILVPLSLFSPRVRQWTWAHISSLEIDPSYVRPLPPAGEMPVWEQAMCFAVCLGLGVAAYSGVISWTHVFIWYGLAAFILAVNAIRTLVAHRYAHVGDQAINIEEQYLDSTDIPGNLFTALWAPVGLRYHATHHLFPGIPYHNLASAHRRLASGLKHNAAIYHRATRPSLAAALAELWAAAAGQPVPQVTYSSAK